MKMKCDDTFVTGNRYVQGACGMYKMFHADIWNYS